MRLDRAGGDIKPGADLAVRQPFRHQEQHLTFPIGDALLKVERSPGTGVGGMDVRTAPGRRRVAANRVIRRRVTLGASNASPAAITRIAASRSDGGASLRRNPLAPARRRRRHTRPGRTWSGSAPGHRCSRPPSRWRRCRSAPASGCPSGRRRDGPRGPPDRFRTGGSLADEGTDPARWRRSCSSPVRTSGWSSATTTRTLTARVRRGVARRPRWPNRAERPASPAWHQVRDLLPRLSRQRGRRPEPQRIHWVRQRRSPATSGGHPGEGRRASSAPASGHDVADRDDFEEEAALSAYRRIGLGTPGLRSPRAVEVADRRLRRAGWGLRQMRGSVAKGK